MSKPELTFSRGLEKLKEHERDEIVTRLVARIETEWNVKDDLPTLDSLAEKAKLSPLRLRQLLKDHVNPKLEARGIPIYDFTPVGPKSYVKRDELDFDPKFVLACNIILDTGSTKSFNARMKELEPLGITSKTWSNWMKQPRYFDYAQKVFNRKFDKELDMQADMALARNIQSGDLQSIKYYKELTGKFRPKDENTMTIMMMLKMMMEIISRHVPPDVIDVVAEELESSPVGMLLSGDN